ncbi:DMT family transporter [Eubacteriaceae bacterium ES2]|nr:DMT family transporter [Eubacteriaceae bacterium ES2]
MADKLQKRGLVFLLATVCCLLWGSAYPFIKIGYQLFAIETTGSQILFAGCRFSMAGIMTWVIASVYKKELVFPDRSEWTSIISLGLIQTSFQYLFFYIGLANTTGVKAAIINPMSVFLVIFFAHLILKEKLTRYKIFGCLLGMAGVLIVQLNGVSLNGDFKFLGEGFMLLACLASALGTIMTRVYTKKSDAMTLTAFQLCFGGLVLIGVGLLSGGQIHPTNVLALLVLFYLAVLSATAFSVWTILIKHNPVGIVAVYSFMIPVFGVILSGLILGEAFLNLRTLFSLVCVSLGIWLVNRQPKVKANNSAEIGKKN